MSENRLDFRERVGEGGCVPPTAPRLNPTVEMTKVTMRTTLLAITWLTCCAPVFGQGTLQVGNSFTGVFRAQIYGVDPVFPSLGICGPPSSYPLYFNGPLLQGTGFTFALFAGTAGVSDPGALQLVLTTTFRTASADIFPAGSIFTTTVSINGVAPGAIAALQIRVWDNQGGTITSWAQVLANSNTPWGTYGVFYSQPLGGSFGGTIITPPPMTGWTSFNIAAGGNICNVPEPSVLTVTALATVSLYIRRKPKSKPMEGTK